MSEAGGDVVLCVDDEVVILMALRLELKRHYEGRFRVETVTSPDDAIAAAKAFRAGGARVVLVITDWIMTGMRGDELVAKLRESWPDMKAVLITGRDDADLIDSARRMELFSARIPKPWRPEALHSAIESCLDSNHGRSQG